MKPSKASSIFVPRPFIGKKGQVLILLVFVAFMLLFIHFASDFLKEEQAFKGRSKIIGQVHVMTKKMDVSSEASKMYYEKLGDYVLPYALKMQGQKGGLTQDQIDLCGMHGTYSYWISPDNSCRPDMKESLVPYISSALNEYVPYRYVFSVSDSDTLFVNAVSLDVISIVKTYSYATISIEQTENEKSEAERSQDQKVSLHYRPSFKMHAEFDPYIYHKLWEKVNELDKTCSSAIDFSSCARDELKHYSYEMPELFFEMECSKDSEKLLNSFSSSIQACYDSYNTDCYCDSGLDVLGVSDGEYLISYKSDGAIMLGDLEVKTDAIPYIGDPDTHTSKDLEIEVGYRKGFDSAASSGANIRGIYKPAMDEYNKERKVILVDDISGMKKCKYRPRTIDICVSQKNEFVTKDGKTSIPIKFSAYIKDVSPPTTVKNLYVMNDPLDERSLSISFDRAAEEDISGYEIFLLPREDADISSLTPVKVIRDIDLSIQETTVKTQIDVPEDLKDYLVSVITVDVEGNKDLRAPSSLGVSYDDIAPDNAKIISVSPGGRSVEGGYYEIDISGTSPINVEVRWEKPLTNENGKELLDLHGYFVFISETKEAYMVLDPDASLDEKKGACSGVCTFTAEERLLKEVSPGHYFVKVLPTDEVGNIPKQLDIVPESYNVRVSGEDRTIVVASSSSLFARPVATPIISSCYGWRDLNGKKDWHDGIDFTGDVGDSVMTVKDGVVSSVCINDKNIASGGERLCRGFGTNVIIRHDDGSYTRYSHLSEVLVNKGDMVMKGQEIGKLGNTGYSFGAHLDFKYYPGESFSEIVGDYSRNPMCFFGFPYSFSSIAYSCSDQIDGAGMKAC